MNVFGHINECHKINLLSLTRRINMPRQPPSPVVIGKQWPTLILHFMEKQLAYTANFMMPWIS